MAFGLALAANVAAGVSSSIELQVLEPPERAEVIRGFPATVGLVFPDGELQSLPGGCVVDDQGRRVPFEAEATGWWDADRTRIKWLLLRFRVSTDRSYVFQVGGPSPRPTGQPIAVLRGRDVRVSTGPLDVRLSGTQPGLFAEVRLNGRPMAEPSRGGFVLVADDDERRETARLSDWSLELEQSTAARASVKATAVYLLADDRPLARLDVRYLFYAGESFVRLYKTVTWMRRPPTLGVREMALRLKPTFKGAHCRVGLSDYGREACNVALTGGSQVEAWQDQGDRYRVLADDHTRHEGRRLGGWVALGSANGAAVSVSHRFAWQTYPTRFVPSADELRIQFWPDVGDRLRFTPDGILPPDFYHSHIWKHFWYSKDAGHHINEYRFRRGRNGTKVASPYFLWTPEGIAFTHELIIGFHDQRPGRSAAELNSVTQHPVILRQDPASAMRVPFMGFDIMPVNGERHPNVERAVDLLGRFAMMRWVKQHNYGLMRFGMVLWGQPIHPNRSIYRWMDNLQYDQQLIPWLLFMRGGARRFFEDAEIVSRYAMDLNTNHYSTRGYPSGFQATCGGGMPFPNLGFLNWNMKGVKIHFLNYYYHLTGYRRAKEVRDEVISGVKRFVLSLSDDPPERHSTAREIYNMNVFWANAYEETWDPVIGKLAAESRKTTATREYDQELNAFRSPQVYLYNGLVLQQRMSGDRKLRDVMLRHLGESSLTVREGHGARTPMDTIGCAWAYDQTRDRGYANAAWNVAQMLADLIPDATLDREEPVDFCIRGNMYYRHFLMPILVGASLGDRLGLAEASPSRFSDVYALMQPTSVRDRTPRLTAWLRSRRDGNLAARVFLRGDPGKAVTFAVSDPDGKQVAHLSLTPKPGRPKDRFYPRDRSSAEGQFIAPEARRGAIYRVAIASKGRRGNIRLLGDADMVYQFPEGDQHAVTSTAGGQSYTGTRIYTKTVRDTITVEMNSNIFHRPYVIRDALTGELIHRYALGEPLRTTHNVGTGRMLEFLMAGARAYRAWSIEGVAPYYAARREDWFDPKAR